MDLNEAARRILRRHWLIIILLTMVGLAVPVALAKTQPPSYQATARIIIGSTDTRDAQEATALSDTGLALATSRDVIGRALQQVGIQRDPVLLAEEVHVTSVGTSGVLELSVTDAGPHASAAIVNALANEIVRMRTDAVFAAPNQALAQTDQAIADVNQRIADIEAQASTTVARWGNVDALTLAHAQAMAERSSLESQRQQLQQALLAAVPPRIVSAAPAVGVLVPAALATRMAIGGLLGLVLGVALAATRESLRPTLSGSAIARHLGAPLLGRLSRPPRVDSGVTDPWLANYLTLAADAAGVTSVQLVPVGPWVDVSRLARDLDAREGGPHVVPLELAPEGPHDDALPRLSASRGAGIVAVVPNLVKGTAMFADIERHSELARRPVIGVITYRGRAGRRRTAPAPAKRHSADVADRTATPAS